VDTQSAAEATTTENQEPAATRRFRLPRFRRDRVDHRKVVGSTAVLFSADEGDPVPAPTITPRITPRITPSVANLTESIIGWSI
jgi:hypothetical protein